MTVPDYEYQAYVRCGTDAAWRAIVDGDQTVEYFYGTRVESSWAPGDPLRYLSPTGEVVADGRVIAIEPGERLEMTFHPRWDPVLDQAGSVREVWSLEEVEGVTRVTVACYDLDAAGPAYAHFAEGVPLIVSGMKTLLETGEPLAR